LGFSREGDISFGIEQGLEDIHNGLHSINRTLVEKLTEIVVNDEKLNGWIEESLDFIKGIHHGFTRTSNILAAAGFEDMEELGASIGKGAVDGGLRDLFADLTGKVGGNIFGTAIQTAITTAFVEAQKQQWLETIGKGKPAEFIEGQIGQVELEAGKAISPFAGLMGGLAGGLISAGINKLFRKDPPVPKKPVPVKVVNWGDMTAQLLRASSRRAVSPMITSGNNITLSRTFTRDLR